MFYVFHISVFGAGLESREEVELNNFKRVEVLSGRLSQPQGLPMLMMPSQMFFLINCLV